MRRLATSAAFAALAVVSLGLVTNDASAADRQCNGKSKTVKIGIKGKNQRPVAVKHDGKDAANLGVCIGDTIVWSVSAEDRTIVVEFLGKAPFVGEKRLVGKHSKVKAVINNADAGQSYDYVVQFKNGEKMQTSLRVVGPT